MSRLLRAAAIAGGGRIVAPVSPSRYVWPDPLDDLHATLRPTFRPLTTLHVGEGKGFESPSSAMYAATQIQSEELKKYGLIHKTPDQWIEIVIHPGHYFGWLNIPMMCSVVGHTGNPEDVTIQSETEDPGGYASGTAVTGGMQHIEGITLFMGPKPDRSWPKYPIHHTGHGNTTTNLVNCRLESFSGGTAIGMDGGPGHTFTAYKVWMNGGTNMHGPSSADLPMQMNWVNCEAPSVNYSAYGFNSVYQHDWADEIWIVGGNIPSASSRGQGTTVHAPPTTVVGGDCKKDNRQDWTVPVGCMSDITRSHYYPSE